ncbi:preprotein translocase subunit SecE [Amycolatopsis sp. K13G38]|uniref:Protein translocase subunit SecE n=1 Tax=Amycolatopsis acididurans TaxID=2724524 RepID=A0ABX1JD68_9PSEU|nr:preprotein translocase subunit SecE [Amycolatopsis acididurans]NKQ56401.1 preprotein translocase subunit SecE [Amycolatopsis acididurans]
MSDSDAGGEKEQESKRASRPVTAAARRERRASARPAGKATAKDQDKARPAAKAGSSTEGTGKAAEAKKGRATPKRVRKDKKPSLLARLMRFVREVWAELRKVIWPTRKQMVTYTTVVLVFVAFMVALVYLLDFVFRKGVFWLFG